MEYPGVTTVIELIARALEIIGVAVIALAFAHAILRSILHFARKQEDAYERLKTYLGRALLLGLELLVAADIIQTVAIEPTMDSLLSLGLLIIVRIILGWSIAVEIEGCWPWQVAENKKSEIRSQRSEGSGPLTEKE